MTSPKQLMLVLLQQGCGYIGFPNVMNNKMKTRNPIFKFDMHHHELSLSKLLRSEVFWIKKKILLS
jgi:hypothetical protein